MHASYQGSVADFVNDIGSFHDSHYGNYRRFPQYNLISYLDREQVSA
jgi:hypothetical protein